MKTIKRHGSTEYKRVSDDEAQRIVVRENKGTFEPKRFWKKQEDSKSKVFLEKLEKRKSDRLSA